WFTKWVKSVRRLLSILWVSVKFRATTSTRLMITKSSRCTTIKKM
ncbi:cpsH domain protein, partial [Vibrio harveyi]